MESVLITGHPRSGTKYIYTVFSAIGCKARFEDYCSNGITASWKHIQPGNFAHKERVQPIVAVDFTKIIHQVRHPLKVIASATTLWDLSMNYIKKFVYLPDPIVNRNNTIRNCMYSYVGWNKLIESKANWRYKVENLKDCFPELCKQVGIPQKNLPKFNAPVNSRKHIEVTWKDLYKIDKAKAEELGEMAIRYGY